MKVMWCWRCKMDVPMLDEEAFAVVERLYSEGMSATKEFRQEHNLPLSECPIDERFREFNRSRFAGRPLYIISGMPLFLKHAE